MSSSAHRIDRQPIVPERLRRIGDGSFAFIHHRFLRDGFLSSLRPNELGLYLFLVLAADRNGLSFYHYDSICSRLEIHLEAYIEARNALIAKDLIAYDGSRFQVLSLPQRPIFEASKPLRTPQDFETSDPATIHSVIRASLRPHDRRRDADQEP